MPAPARSTSAQPSTPQRQLPDFVSSPGLAELFAGFLEDHLDQLRQRTGESPSRFDQIHQGLLSTGASQLKALHAPAQVSS